MSKYCGILEPNKYFDMDDIDLGCDHKQKIKDMGLEYCVFHSDIMPSLRDTGFSFQCHKKEYPGFETDYRYRFVWNKQNKSCYDNCNYKGREDMLKEYSKIGYKIIQKKRVELQGKLDVLNEHIKKLNEIKFKKTKLEKTVTVISEKMNLLSKKFESEYNKINESAKEQKRETEKITRLFKNNVTNRELHQRMSGSIEKEIRLKRLLDRKKNNDPALYQIAKMKTDIESITKQIKVFSTQIDGQQMICDGHKAVVDKVEGIVSSDRILLGVKKMGNI
jgi:hypothetical protein